MIDRATALPPQAVRDRVAQLVRQRGSENFAGRDAATKALRAMGPPIAGLLAKHRRAEDPEVRQRIGTLLKELGADGKPDGQPGNRPKPVPPPEPALTGPTGAAVLIGRDGLPAPTA